jgi:hypothetical protein
VLVEPERVGHAFHEGRSVSDQMAAADVEEGWGPFVPPRRRARRAVADAEELLLAQLAQDVRAERATGGYQEELRAFYGDPGLATADVVERRITAADFRREARARAQAARDAAQHHGSASCYPTCTDGPGGRRCSRCRAYQAWRVSRNRQARRDRALCTGNRSSYDAGCRCVRCTAANALGCKRWREEARRT